jgi:1-acyl-sn-glycerol-3-phosphate acyltransferase
MDERRGSVAKGVLTLLAMGINLVFWVALLFTVALLKFLVPIPAWRRVSSRWMVALAENWISGNTAIFDLTGALPREVRGVDGLRRREWYLVVSNHRSWVDILVLQASFNRRIPFLKFFLKQQLIWVPLLGLAWWALDFPFMRRHSAAYLARHPEKRGQDLAATQLACARFREIPTSVMNFVEGTRFTPAKHAASGSPFRHLLAPRAGGVSFVLAAMGGMLHSMLDVTIAYAKRTPSFWDLCCGRVGHVLVDVRQRPIEPWMSAGDYAEDPAFRERFQQWLRGIWVEKDAQLEQRQQGQAATA